MSALVRDYECTINELARWNSQEQDATDLVIYSYDDLNRKVIRLLEVSDLFPGDGNEQVWAITFGASTEVPFPSTVALVSHEQWEAICEGRLALPEGWAGVEPRKVFPRDDAQ